MIRPQLAWHSPDKLVYKEWQEKSKLNKAPMSEELKLLHAEDSLRKGSIQKLSPLKSTHALRSRFSPAVRVVVYSRLCP